MLLRDLQAESVMSDIVEWIKAQHKFSPVFEKNLGNEYPSGGMITSFNGA